MKITRNTPAQLILADTPWFIGIAMIIFILAFVGPGLLLASTGGENIFFGLLFAVVGGGLGATAFALFVRRVQVILDRSADQILVQRRSVFGYQVIEHKLSNLSHAETETTTSRSNGKTRTLYRSVLILRDGMSAGRHPVAETYSSGSGAQRLTDAVNEWLKAGG
jgi:hypothetical protein